MVDIRADVAGGNWPTGATWIGGAAPTNADNAILEAASGNVVVNAASAALSLDTTSGTGSFGGTLTLNSGQTLTLGGSGTPPGNILLKLNSGMTLTLGASTAEISFNPGNGTQVTVETAGKVLGRVEMLGFTTGSPNVLLLDNLTATSFESQGGIFNTNGMTVTVSTFRMAGGNGRTITLGASVINVLVASNIAWDAANATLNAGTSVINMTGSNATFGGSTKTYSTLNITGSNSPSLTGINVFTNLNRIGTAAKTDGFSISANQTVSGDLTLTGDSSINRLLVRSDVIGTPRTITNTTANEIFSNVDFRDFVLTAAFDASAITGLSGDCGGNSGITLTTPETQSWAGATTGLASDSTKWASAGTPRVPLPQDDVIISQVFSGQSISFDMPRSGKNIDFTGSSGSFTVNFNATTEIYGSLTLVSSMTLSASQPVTFMGRGNHTITSAGKNFGNNVTISAFGGTYTLQDALSCSAALFIITNGTFDANDYNVTCSRFNVLSSTSKTINMGSGNWNITTATVAAAFVIGFASGLTLNAEDSTIIFTSTATIVRTFAGAGATFNNFDYTVAGSTGGLDVTGANTFNNFAFSDANNARALRFTAATTTTINGRFLVNGTASRLMSISSITAAQHTLSSPNLQVCDYLSLTNSVAIGGPWYAGSHSVDNGGNSGWIFADPPWKEISNVPLLSINKISGLLIESVKKISGL